MAADVAHVAWAVNLACLGFHVWPYRADDPEHADELRLDLDPQPGTGFAEARRPRGSSRRCSTSSASPASPRPPATAACTSTCGSQPRWDSYEVRSAAVAAARELERRRPDILTAAWWKEERGERILVDYNQNAPHKTVFGAWSVRARVGAQVSTPFALGRARRVHPDELTIATRAGAPGERRRSVGGDQRRPAVARAAARAARARPRERPARRAVAARLPEAARRAAARRAEPRAQAELTRGSMNSAARDRHH